MSLDAADTSVRATRAGADIKGRQPAQWTYSVSFLDQPGFLGPAYQRWTAGLRFYYAAASWEVFGRRSEGLAASLAATQRGDGSWQNSENLVKEDDPLIATAFAVMALA